MSIEVLDLSQSQIEPGSRLDVESLDEFDAIALTVGCLLLERVKELGTSLPFEQNVPETMYVPGTTATIRSRFEGLTDPDTTLEVVFLKPTLPGDKYFVHGAHANQLSVARTAEGTCLSVEAGIFVRKTEVIEVRKIIDHRVWAENTENFEASVARRLVPRMRKRGSTTSSKGYSLSSLIS